MCDTHCDKGRWHLIIINLNGSKSYTGGHLHSFHSVYHGDKLKLNK